MRLSTFSYLSSHSRLQIEADFRAFSKTATSTTLSLRPAPPPPPEGSATLSSKPRPLFQPFSPLRPRYPFFVFPSHPYSPSFFFFMSLPLEPLRSALCSCHASCGYPVSRSSLLSRADEGKKTSLSFSLCADLSRRQRREEESLHVPNTEGHE
jgi:hypothetical protein